MKLRNHLFSRVMVAGWLAIGAARLQAADTNAPEPPKSVFVMPAGPKEGRDPFFPDSLRPYDIATQNSRPVLSLHIKGFLGKPGHPLVIINNHTFAEGDEQEVSTPSGPVEVRCVAIRGDSAIVEAGGQREVLTFEPSP
jgi:hypothetical protein